MVFKDTLVVLATALLFFGSGFRNGIVLCFMGKNSGVGGYCFCSGSYRVIVPRILYSSVNTDIKVTSPLTAMNIYRT